MENIEEGILYQQNMQKTYKIYTIDILKKFQFFF